MNTEKKTNLAEQNNVLMQLTKNEITLCQINENIIEFFQVNGGSFEVDMFSISFEKIISRLDLKQVHPHFFINPKWIDSFDNSKDPLLRIGGLSIPVSLTRISEVQNMIQSLQSDQF